MDNKIVKDLKLNEYFRSKDKSGVLMKRYVKLEKRMLEIGNQVSEHGILFKSCNFVNMDILKSTIATHMKDVERMIGNQFADFRSSIGEEIKSLVTKHTMEEKIKVVQNDYASKVGEIDEQLQWMKQFLASRFGDQFKKGASAETSEEKTLEDRLNELLQKVEKMDNQISSPSFISQNGNNASNIQNQSILNEETMKEHDDLLKELQNKLEMVHKTVNNDLLPKQRTLEEESKNFNNSFYVDEINGTNHTYDKDLKSPSKRTKQLNKQNYDKIGKELKEFEYIGLKPLEERKKTFAKYIDSEFTNFKEFVKNKVEPLKNRVLKIQSQIESFKNPILQELIKIRSQNEALLKDLARQK